MDKKAASISINTIIITLLAVIVLVVLVVVFKKQIASLFSSFSDLIKGATEALSEIKLFNIIK